MKNTIPALSIRQPWAWLILQANKSIENRTWATAYRGPLYIHASAGMTGREYRETADFVERHFSIHLPPINDLERGGIVGLVTLVDCVRKHRSPWFFGPYGWILADPQPLPFRPCPGQLRLFKPDLAQELAAPAIG